MVYNAQKNQIIIQFVDIYYISDIIYVNETSFKLDGEYTQ